MSSVESLVERLSAEVAAVTERVHLLQAKAARYACGQEQRFECFVALIKRIDAIFQPRIKAFTNVNVFKTIEKSVTVEKSGPAGRELPGGTTTLVVPYSDECPAKVKLAFHLGHDGPIENVILEYNLEIIPVFISFEKHDQLIIPIDKPDEDAIATWFDDKLVGFTRTYFEMYFTDQYQKQSMETDPVMNIRFPRAFAAGKKEYQGRTYHLYTKESLQKFEQTPADYVGAPETSRLSIWRAQSEPDVTSCLPFSQQE
jgi:YHS domain-containing protein